MNKNRLIIFSSVGLVLLGVLVLAVNGCQTQDNPDIDLGKSKSSIPATAIPLNKGNLRIQFNNLLGIPGDVKQSAYCQNGKYMVDVPAGRRVLDAKSIRKLCLTLKNNPSLAGNHRCSKAKAGTPEMSISGKLEGKDFQASYNMGPCPKTLEVWQKITAAWMPPDKGARKTSWQQVMLLSPPADQLQPYFAVEPSNDPSWKYKYRGGSPPCVVSMARNPYALCALKLKGTSGIPIYIRMPAEQIQQLIGAPPQKILQLISKAAIVPPPPGYPGYSPGAIGGGIGSLPENGRSLSK